MKTIISALILASSFSAFAVDCRAPQTYLERATCAKQDLDQADVQLNDNYRALRGLSDPAVAEKLKLAQRAWIAFRDAECDMEAEKYSGGRDQLVMKNTCLADLTKNRARKLGGMINQH